MVQPTDEALMERFCNGEDVAFDVLFERHAPAVQGFLTRMVRDAALAEDLLQSTMLSVVRARGRFEHGMRFQPWLMTIAANAARDALRKRKLDPQLTDGGETHAGALALEGGSVPAVMGDPGLRRRLEAAFMALPESQREAVLLHKVQGFGFGDVAQALGITETAARIRAHRGYERLRTLLGDLDDRGAA